MLNSQAGWERIHTVLQSIHTDVKIPKAHKQPTNILLHGTYLQVAGRQLLRGLQWSWLPGIYFCVIPSHDVPGLFWAANRIGQKWPRVSFRTGHKKTSLGTPWQFYFLESLALGWPGAHLKDGQGGLVGGPNGEERSAPLTDPMSEIPVGPRTTQLSSSSIADPQHPPSQTGLLTLGLNCYQARDSWCKALITT